MKKFSWLLIFAVLAGLSSCEVVGGIFKAGMIWGIFLVVVIVAAIFYLISKTRK